MVVAVLMVATLSVLGCHQSANPWHDSLAGRQPVTTPSVDAERAAAREPSTKTRSHAPIYIDPYSGRVSHGPLYFADPFESDVNDDEVFAWTGEDYGQFIFGPSRFLVNIALFPIHAVATPPWVFLHSDGAS
jgi:hypothetical protein